MYVCSVYFGMVDRKCLIRNVSTNIGFVKIVKTIFSKYLLIEDKYDYPESRTMGTQKDYN